MVRAVDPLHLQPPTEDVPQSWVGSRVMAPLCPQGLIHWQGSPVGMWSCKSLLGKMELGPPQALSPERNRRSSAGGSQPLAWREAGRGREQSLQQREESRGRQSRELGGCKVG